MRNAQKAALMAMFAAMERRSEEERAGASEERKSVRWIEVDLEMLTHKKRKTLA